MLLVLVQVALAGAFVEKDVRVLWEATSPEVSFGWAIADVPDVDGDGVTDALTCDPFAGGKSGLTVLLSGATGDEIFRSEGAAGSWEGYAVAFAGDQNGDGVSDVLSGAPSGDEAIVHSGVDGAVLDVLHGTSGESFGTAVARAGDIDGDGTDDLVIGADAASGGGKSAGRVVLMSGGGGGEIWAVEGDAGDQLGSGAGYLGDVTGDGVPDVLVGAQSGAVLVLSGTDGSEVYRFTEAGTGALGVFFVSGVGDLDGDGVPDIYAGDYANSTAAMYAGRAWVWSGATGDLLLSIDGAAAFDGLGPGRYAGDVDGDGTPDLIIGSYSSSTGAAHAGKVTVYSGADGSVIRTVTSTTAGEQFGFDAVGVGDADGDGAIDLLVSAAGGNTVYLIAGNEPVGGDTGDDSGLEHDSGLEDDSGGGDATGADDAGGGGDDDQSVSDGGCGCGSGPTRETTTALWLVGFAVSSMVRRSRR